MFIQSKQLRRQFLVSLSFSRERTVPCGGMQCELDLCSLYLLSLLERATLLSSRERLCLSASEMWYLYCIDEVTRRCERALICESPTLNNNGPIRSPHCIGLSYLELFHCTRPFPGKRSKSKEITILLLNIHCFIIMIWFDVSSL